MLTDTSTVEDAKLIDIYKEQPIQLVCIFILTPTCAVLWSSISCFIVIGEILLNVHPYNLQCLITSCGFTNNNRGSRQIIPYPHIKLNALSLH
jgi:hypothetical protein